MDDILLEKARQRFGHRKRCAHPHSTLCQHIDPGLGWFVAYQCDDCGMVTQREVRADDLMAGHDLPFVDAGLWEQAVALVNRSDDTATRTLAFVAQAVRI